jgi:hypothetical protein
MIGSRNNNLPKIHVYKGHFGFRQHTNQLLSIRDTDKQPFLTVCVNDRLSL